MIQNFNFCQELTLSEYFEHVSNFKYCTILEVSLKSTHLKINKRTKRIEKYLI